MAANNFHKDQVEALSKLLSSKRRFALTAHFNPDGDAVGSVLGLGHALQNAGHQVNLVLPNSPPYFLEWMPGFGALKFYDKEPDAVTSIIAESDALFCLDFNQPNRVGKMEGALSSSRLKVLIDHHQQPDDFADIVFSDTTSCATCQLIHDILMEVGLQDQITLDSAVSLYTGIMTDSGSFRYGSTTDHTHEVAAALLRKGVEPDLVYSSIYNTNSIERTRLWGYALSEKLEYLPGQHTAIMALSLEDLTRFRHRSGDTEGLVNEGLSINGVRLSAFFKEADGFIKMSLRSTGDLAVDRFMKEHFNGGGHSNAAGGRCDLSLKGSVAKFKELLPQFLATMAQ